MTSPVDESNFDNKLNEVIIFGMQQFLSEYTTKSVSVLDEFFQAKSKQCG